MTRDPHGVAIESLQVHPACALFPMLDESALAELAADIEAHGLLEPIVVHQGLVLDGRNRLAACRLAGTDPEFREWEGDEADIVSWITSKNIHRRHLETSQRAMIAARLADLRLGANQTSEGLPIGRAAEMVGVGTRSAHRAREVLDSGNEALIAAVDSGQMSVSAAAQSLRPPAPAPEPEHPITKDELLPVIEAELDAWLADKPMPISLLRNRVAQRLKRPVREQPFMAAIFEGRSKGLWCEKSTLQAGVLVGDIWLQDVDDGEEETETPPPSAPAVEASAELEDLEQQAELDAGALLEILEESPGTTLALARLELAVVLEQQERLGAGEKFSTERWQAALDFGSVEGWWVQRADLQALELVTEDDAGDDEGEEETGEEDGEEIDPAAEAELALHAIEGAEGAGNVAPGHPVSRTRIRESFVYLAKVDEVSDERLDAALAAAVEAGLVRKDSPWDWSRVVKPQKPTKPTKPTPSAMPPAHLPQPTRVPVLVTGVLWGKAARNLQRLEALGRLAVARGYTPILPALMLWQDVYGTAGLGRDDTPDATIETALSCSTALAAAVGQLGGGLWELLPDDPIQSVPELEAESKAFGDAHPGPSRPHSLSMTWRSWKPHFEASGLLDVWEAA